MCDSVIGNIRDNEILPNGQSNLAAAIVLKQVSNLKHLFGGNPPCRHSKTDIIKPGLPLPEDADVIGVIRRAPILSRAKEGSVGASLQLMPEAFATPIFKQKCQTRFRAIFTRSMITEDKDNMIANRRRFLRRDEDIQRRGDAIAAGAHFPSYGNVEPFYYRAFDLLCCRSQRNILALRVSAGISASCYCHIELSWQICVLLVAHEHLRELPDHRRRVKKLVGREPCDRAADDIADIVHAGLQ